MQPISQRSMTSELTKKIDDAGIIAVLIIDEVKNTIPLAKALIEGGVAVIELTLRTPGALDAAKIIKKEFPEVTLGFGTVLNVDQVKAVVDVGADFAVSPGCNPKIIVEAYKQGLSFAPGVMTPSDIEVAIQEGCRILKFFPAETSGGLKHLESMSAPYNYLDLKFIPLGGCNMKNAADYLRSDLITAIGGSWVAKRNLIQSKDWKSIKSNAKEISDLVLKIKNLK